MSHLVDRLQLSRARLGGLAIIIVGVSILALINYVPVIQEQNHYLSLSTDDQMDYVLNEMSCRTILLSVVKNEASTEPTIKRVNGEIVEINYPSQLEYYFHIPLSDSGFMAFKGLDEKVEECRNG